MGAPLLILLTVVLGICIGFVVKEWSKRQYLLSLKKQKRTPITTTTSTSNTTTATSLLRTPLPSGTNALNNGNSDISNNPVEAVSPRSLIKEGYLRKRSRTHPHTIGWQKRFFVANQSELSYYKDHKRTSYPHPLKYQTISCSANVITLTFPVGGCIYLSAETDEEARDWVNHLTKKLPSSNAVVTTTFSTNAAPVTTMTLASTSPGVAERAVQAPASQVLRAVQAPPALQTLSVVQAPPVVQVQPPLLPPPLREKPPPSVTGILPCTLEELTLVKNGVIEFRRLAANDIEEWVKKGSELAVAVKNYNRAVERFIWARNFNIINAVAMWRETVMWRDSRGLDMILDAPYPKAKEIKLVFPGRYHGFDKLGRLLYIEDTGSLNLSALMGVTDNDGMLNYHLSTMEYMHKYGFPQSCVVGQDPSIDQVVTILNLKGLHTGLFKPQVLTFLKMVLDVDQNYYPECLGKTFIVNAPTIFGYVWRIVKPWLAPRVMSKIEIVGQVQSGSPELLALFEPDQLPTYLGGTCDCKMSTDCPNAPGQLMRDFLRIAEIGRPAFDKEQPRPNRKFGFGDS